MFTNNTYLKFINLKPFWFILIVKDMNSKMLQAIFIGYAFLMLEFLVFSLYTL